MHYNKVQIRGLKYCAQKMGAHQEHKEYKEILEIVHQWLHIKCTFVPAAHVVHKMCKEILDIVHLGAL